MSEDNVNKQEPVQWNKGGPYPPFGYYNLITKDGSNHVHYIFQNEQWDAWLDDPMFESALPLTDVPVEALFRSTETKEITDITDPTGKIIANSTDEIQKMSEEDREWVRLTPPQLSPQSRKILQSSFDGVSDETSLELRLMFAIGGSCTCDTKTNIVYSHHPICHYRLFTEAYDELIRVKSNA